MELSFIVPDKKTKGTIEVSDEIFSKEFNEPLIHQVVTAYLAGARSGNSAQKTRAEVRGGGKKPWRQKGTGRARAGTIRSPLWRGGGVIFAAKKRDYSQKVNRKMYRNALCSILSELIRQNRLLVVEDLQISEPKTKVLLAVLEKLGVKNKLLIVPEVVDHSLDLAARNVKTIEVSPVDSIDPVSLIRFEQVLFTTKALKKLEERLT